MTSEFKTEVEIGSNVHVCSEKIAKIGKNQHQTAKILVSYRKLGSSNPFLLTNLRT